MHIKRTLSYGAALALALAGSLIAPTAAHAAGSCNSTVSRQSTLNANHFGAIPALNGSTTCELGQGNQGVAVQALQFTLNRCFGAGLATDGIFGPKTKAALMNAQGIVGTDRDGRYGPLTRNAFNSHRRWRVDDDVAHSFCESVFL